MEHLGFEIITGPAIEPITMAELRLLCRVGPDDTTRDALLRLNCTAARETTELMLGMAVGQQVIEDTHDGWPAEFCLRRSPVHSVTSIKYFDEDNVEHTVDPSTYYLNAVREPKIALLGDETWTDDALRTSGAIKVRYVAGYGREFTATADAGADTLAATSHGLADGDDFLIRSTGTVPGGLASDTRYWVRDAAANTFKITSTQGGAAIDITDAGSGTITVTKGIPRPVFNHIGFLVAQWFDINTPAVGNTIDKAIVEVPNTLKFLSSNVRRWGF